MGRLVVAGLSWNQVFNKVKREIPFYKQVIQPMNRVTYNLYFWETAHSAFWNQSESESRYDLYQV